MRTTLQGRDVGVDIRCGGLLRRQLARYSATNQAVTGEDADPSALNERRQTGKTEALSRRKSVEMGRRVPTRPAGGQARSPHAGADDRGPGSRLGHRVQTLQPGRESFPRRFCSHAASLSSSPARSSGTRLSSKQLTVSCRSYVPLTPWQGYVATASLSSWARPPTGKRYGWLNGSGHG